MSLTLEHIAKLAGVSRSTVSRVINDHPNVRPEVRQEVWRVIHQEGYEPHAAARSLVTKRTHVIGLLIPRAVTSLFTDPFFPLLIRGIADTCNGRGCHLMLSLFTGRADQDGLYRQVLRGGYLDGVVVASTTFDDPITGRLIEDSIPFVVVGRHPDDRVNYVDSDNVNGSRAAVEYLLALGHERVATITGPLSMMPGCDRLEGYRQALKARGLLEEEGLVAEGDFTEDGGRLAMQQLLAHQPTAVFAASDIMAIGAIKVIKEAGKRIPEDIAVIGFDDLPVGSLIEPALTTVRQPIDRLGALAADLLINLIERVAEGPQRMVLPTQLIVRSSSGSRKPP